VRQCDLRPQRSLTKERYRRLLRRFDLPFDLPFDPSDTATFTGIQLPLELGPRAVQSGDIVETVR
jgi:hypothetical protein